MDRHLFRNLLFSRAKEAPYENKTKLAQQLQRRSCLKMLTDALTDDDKRFIIIARPEHSSGKLKRRQFFPEGRFDISYILSPM